MAEEKGSAEKAAESNTKLEEERAVEQEWKAMWRATEAEWEARVTATKQRVDAQLAGRLNHHDDGDMHHEAAEGARTHGHQSISQHNLEVQTTQGSLRLGWPIYL